MKVYKEIESFKVNRPVLTIGSFDGVHHGHRAILNALKQRAVEANGESVVMIFWPHPRLVVGKSDQSLRLLSTLDEKIELLRKEGIQHLLIYPFTLEFASLTACDFIEKVLRRQLGIKMLVVGFNQHFGHNREGNFDTLKNCVNTYGFDLVQIESYNVEDEKVSSTLIRKALNRGAVADAAKLLGYTYNIFGRVVGGKRIGRTIGFPTANISLNDPHKLIPADGVYGVSVNIGAQLWHGMLNIGFRPTVLGSKKTIEVHIFDFEQNIYEHDIKMSFLFKVRNEMRFNSLDELVAQLHKDKDFVLKHLHHYVENK